MGDGTTNDRHVPGRIGLENDWVAVGAIVASSFGLKSDGSLWAWGDNRNGVLGDGIPGIRTLPTQIGEDNDWLSVDAGGAHVLAVKSDGSLWAWGANDEGRLGNGTTTGETSPIRIGMLTDWAKVSASSHSMALKSDGALWAWGPNEDGQLGDGTTTDRHSPVRVGTDTWLAIATASLHSAALKSDHSLWTWGSNTMGQLGIGTVSYRMSPGRVFFEGDASILPLSPETGRIFEACSLLKTALPQFTWEATEPFTKYTLFFSAPSTGPETPFAKATVKGSFTSWVPSAGTWKKILRASHNNGSSQVIYWKIVGQRADKSTETSEVRNFRVEIPEAATINSPAEAAVLPALNLPVFDFDTNCNVKFSLEVSSLEDFSTASMIKSFKYSTKDPNVETTLQKTLSSGQWSSVKKLVGDGTGYFRIRAWDVLKRETISEVRSFTIANP